MTSYSKAVRQHELSFGRSRKGYVVEVSKRKDRPYDGTILMRIDHGPDSDLLGYSPIVYPSYQEAVAANKDENWPGMKGKHRVIALDGRDVLRDHSSPGSWKVSPP